MKKLFLSLVAVLIGATAMQAQTSLLATLSHDGEVTAFYGANALREAHAAAADGDVITLSSGTFNTVEISKGITIRGAGAIFNSETYATPTIILGNTNISFPNEENNRKLILEGLLFNDRIYYKGQLYNTNFVKCKMPRIEEYTGELFNALFVHCIITDNFSSEQTATASFVNCIVRSPGRLSSLEFTNCIILAPGNFEGYKYTFNNCIILTHKPGGDYYYSFGSSNIAYNCISNWDIFTSISNHTNKVVSTNTLFKDFEWELNDGFKYDDTMNFTLSDEAASTYLGLDGTQVGIYGGSMPFDPTPTNPQITKANVAAKSTADGKLSVDIEVKAAE